MLMATLQFNLCDFCDFRCHGNKICTVDRSMANQSLADCEFAEHVGFQSDTLYVRYKCLKCM